MVAGAIAGNISAEATTPTGNTFAEAMRGIQTSKRTRPAVDPATRQRMDPQLFCISSKCWCRGQSRFEFSRSWWLAVKLRQISEQPDVRRPRRNAGAERSNRTTGLFDPRSAECVGFSPPYCVRSAQRVASASPSPPLPGHEQRIARLDIPFVNTVDIMISIDRWLFWCRAPTR